MALPDHLFVGTEGDLYDTRDPDWSKGKPVRPGYQRSVAEMTTGRGPAVLQQVKAALRAGPFTFPGAYPLYFITMDGAALSFDAVREQFAQVCDDHLAGSSTGWRIVAVGTNFEDSDLRCDHTGKPIPSAYGEEAA